MIHQNNVAERGRDDKIGDLAVFARSPNESAAGHADIEVGRLLLSLIPRERIGGETENRERGRESKASL